MEQNFGQDLHKKKLVFLASKDMNRLPVPYLEAAPVSFANQNMHWYGRKKQYNQAPTTNPIRFTTQHKAMKHISDLPLRLLM